MKKIFAILAFLFAAPSAAEAPPLASDFESRLIEDSTYGSINWHLDKAELETRGPLIVWLPGSGAYPFFQNFADGSQGFNFPPELLAFRDKAHFLFVDKPGVPFSATLQFDEERQRPVELDNPVYRAGLTKDFLVARAAIAIKAAQLELSERVTQLVVVGGSEGAQYAFAVARQVNADRAIGWGGLALPQYFDFVIDARLQAERGEISREEAQSRVEQVYSAIRTIRKAPHDTVERFDGEAFRRWSSFGPYAAITDMLALDVPLLLVQGGADRNSPILNSDYAMIAFLSEGKANLDYWVYPNLDHYFNDVRPETDRAEPNLSRDVWGRIWQWILAPK